jgi:aconitate hydratase
LGLTGEETFDFGDLVGGEAKKVTVTARADDGSVKEFEVIVRLDTPNEVTYFRNGGILQTVLRNLRG